jgi:acetoacetate decarboxylase
MRKADILKLPSMPMAGPSYPAGPYRFVNREFLVITYETDPRRPARTAGADRAAHRAL